MDMKRTVKSAMHQLRIDKLRKLQTKPINSILAGQDTFVLAPTSSGKSAIYDIPALLCTDKPTIVLEPTIALARFVYCLVRLTAAEEQAAQYKKRARNTVIFYIIAESIWQIKDLILYYYS